MSVSEIALRKSQPCHKFRIFKIAWRYRTLRTYLSILAFVSSCPSNFLFNFEKESSSTGGKTVVPDYLWFTNSLFLTSGKRLRWKPACIKHFLRDLQLILNSTDECFALQTTLSRGYYRFTSDRRYVIDPKPPWLLLFEGSLRNRWYQFSLECVRWCPGFYFKEWKSFFHRFFDRNHPFPSTLAAEHSLISFDESHSCYFAIPKESFCIFYSMRIGS